MIRMYVIISSYSSIRKDDCRTTNLSDATQKVRKGFKNFDFGEYKRLHQMKKLSIEENNTYGQYEFGFFSQYNYTSNIFSRRIITVISFLFIVNHE